MDSRSRKFAAVLKVVGADEDEELLPGTIDDVLLQLIHQQLETVDISRASDDSDVQLHDDVRVALMGIALEKSEMELLMRRRKEIPVTDGDALLSTPPGYLLPSTSNTRMEFMDRESQLLEAEAERSNSRLKQMKSANKKMSTTRMQLQSAIKETEGKSSRCLEQFDEMEIKAATSLSACLSSSYQLMDIFPKPGIEKDDPLESYHQILEDISSLRKPIIDRYKGRVDDIQTLEQAIPMPEEIAAHLSVLRELSTKEWEGTVKAAEETAFREEIRSIVDALGQDNQLNLDEFLSEDTTTESARDVVDVELELAAALKLDQVNILQKKKIALDDAIRLFKERILPPLQAIHDCVSSMHAKTVEAEALLGAFGEEIEAVVDNVPAAALAKATTAEDEGNADRDVLISCLSEFFKLHEPYRPKGAPPLVLLDAEDIKNEIKLWMEYDSTLLKEEQQILAGIPASLENLTASHASLLSATYKHSPLNSSPPFSDSPKLAEVKRSTQNKVDALGETLVKLQKDIELIESRQAQKKLGLFISKWTTKK